MDAWRPLNIDPDDHVNRRGNHFLNLVARLGEGVTHERAQADLDRIEVRSSEEFAGTHPLHPVNHPVTAHPFREDLLGDVRAEMLLLFGAVALVEFR